MEAQIQPCQAWSVKHTRLKSVPGVGKVVAAARLACLPARGQLSTENIGTLVGVAPLPQDSGQMQGKRTSYGGHAAVRPRLYMATLVAVRHHAVIRTFSDPWLPRGQPTKVALVDCMHKLVTLLNAMLKTGTDWQPPHPPVSHPSVQRV